LSHGFFLEIIVADRGIFMNQIFSKKSLSFLFCLFFVFAAPSVFAAKKKGGKGVFLGGSIAVGLGVAVATAEQDGMNLLVAESKTANGSTAGNLSSAIEYMGHVTFRFSSGLVALQLRPAYFTQDSTGTGTDGNYEYSLSGLSIFPLVRIIPLSNDLIDFFIQFGIGYGSLAGTIRNGARTANFKGGNFGAQVGLGADFCFVADHCFGIEGNYKYLPIPRNIVSSSSGALPNGVSQATPDRELEDASLNDVGTKLSGISGVLMYTFNF
jgi:hypothetical protein